MVKDNLIWEIWGISKSFFLGGVNTSSKIIFPRFLVSSFLHQYVTVPGVCKVRKQQKTFNYRHSRLYSCGRHAWKKK